MLSYEGVTTALFYQSFSALDDGEQKFSFVGILQRAFGESVLSN